MDWAHKRRLVVWIIIAAVIVAALAILGFAIFYKTPTCFDHKQNQNETGIDCGGSCSTLCSAEAQPASVSFARALQQSGRTDVIAYVTNPNQSAVASVTHMTLDVYTADDEDLRTHIIVDIPAGKSTPIFIPGAAPGGITVRQVFLTFDSGYPVWTRSNVDESLAPVATQGELQNLDTAPRITGTLTNRTAQILTNIPVTATVFDASGNAIAASRTLVQTLPPQGTAPLVFTWNEPFSAPVARVELVPLSSVPQVLP